MMMPALLFWVNINFKRQERKPGVGCSEYEPVKIRMSKNGTMIIVRFCAFQRMFSISDNLLFKKCSYLHIPILN